jgi:hypothetical protein
MPDTELPDTELRPEAALARALKAAGFREADKLFTNDPAGGMLIGGVRYQVKHHPDGFTVYRGSRSFTFVGVPSYTPLVDAGRHAVVAYFLAERSDTTPRCGYCGSDEGNDPEYGWCLTCHGL